MSVIGTLLYAMAVFVRTCTGTTGASVRTTPRDLTVNS